MSGVDLAFFTLMYFLRGTTGLAWARCPANAAAVACADPGMVPARSSGVVFNFVGTSSSEELSSDNLGYSLSGS